jgi:hypothetical protein
MRFIVMHKVDAKMEAGERPDPRIIEEMGTLVRESLSTGVFENGAGLHRSARRARLTMKEGKRAVEKGPLVSGNQLVAGCYMVRAGDMGQAVELAAQVASTFGDAEIEIGPVVEPWDLGLIPAPAEQTTGRFLLLRKGDATTEGGVPIPPAAREPLAKLERKLRDDGVLLLSEKLAPSASGARLPAGQRGNRGNWTDGPFAESKELIAGFSILNLPTKAAALTWATRYAEILEGNEVDVRELLDRRAR